MNLLIWLGKYKIMQSVTFTITSSYNKYTTRKISTANGIIIENAILHYEYIQYFMPNTSIVKIRPCSVKRWYTYCKEV